MLCKRQIALLFFVLLTVAMATPVAQAQLRPIGLSDSEEPGSVLVFPLFRTGTLSTSDLGTVPLTGFEISVVCPKGATCIDGEDVDIQAEWVCAGNNVTQTPCNETNFTIDTTVNGTVRFNPSNAPGNTQLVTPPPCSQGYLIVWVVDEFGNPIKFDGLIGDAVLRETSAAATAYNAIPIQADASLATGAAITTGPGHALLFDGNPGDYQQVTGKVDGSVRYSRFASTSTINTSLVLLTLDVNSNRQNPYIDVDFNFYTEGEAAVSRATRFVCWERDFTAVPAAGQIFGAVKGLTTSDTATNETTGAQVTLLGLVITEEKTPAGAILREYAYPFFNDSTPVPTTFTPNF